MYWMSTDRPVGGVMYWVSSDRPVGIVVYWMSTDRPVGGVEVHVFEPHEVEVRLAARVAHEPHGAGVACDGDGRHVAPPADRKWRHKVDPRLLAVELVQLSQRVDGLRLEVSVAKRDEVDT